MLFCSLVFISFFSPIYTLYYFFICIFVYIVGLVMAEKSEKQRKQLFISVISLLILNLCFYKYYRVTLSGIDRLILSYMHVQPIRIPEIIFPLGLSFITFRLIHYHIELYRGNITETSFVDFALYVLFFPTFLAGPVERFPKFYTQTKGIDRLRLRELNYGLWRIILGAIKKFIIADALLGIIMPVLRLPSAYTTSVVIAAVYGAAIWLYLDFGGYCDIAIGISHMFGYSIVENFNQPFLKKNIALYWRNWHISVYSWIRDYFYFPLFVYKGTRLKLYFGIFCTMMVFMIWHAPTANFLFAGIYNGVGLVIWKLFQDLKEKHGSIRHAFDKRFLDPVAVLLTFTYVSFGIGIAFGGTDLVIVKDLLGRAIGCQ
ncbi:MBOAT family O-acyltransferase [Candidatus Omnitrophota bacterium]